ncbi:MAG TPA: hypothetical protein PKE16_01430 [Hyphomicrobium sp.]|nr:hypothetical protein [Hyphomicrobium sp.]
MLDRPAWRDMSTNVPAPGFAPMLSAFNPAAAYMEFLNTSAFRVGGEAVQSWLHFLGTRWLKDLRFPQQLATCKTADDVNVAVSEFWQQASKDYATEFNQLADLTWSAMRTSLVAANCTSTDNDKCCGKCSSSKTAGTE